MSDSLFFSSGLFSKRALKSLAWVWDCFI